MRSILKSITSIHRPDIKMFMHFNLLILVIVFGCSQNDQKDRLSLGNSDKEFISDRFSADWISADLGLDTINTWIAYRKDFQLKNVPKDPAIAKIAVDSKYWLWVNGEIVVFEGGLKRGPTPNDTYYDEVDVSSYLKEGKNSIAILLWYFGKDGFSHKSSGKAGLLFDLKTEVLELLSDESWKSWLHPAFGETEAPHPNYRLPESNIAFDSRKGNFDFISIDYDASSYTNAISVGAAYDSPWNKLVKRPIPQWKDFGLKTYSKSPEFPFVSNGDTIRVNLPYNAQFTPYFQVEAEEGSTIHMLSSNYKGGGAPNVRATYTTKSGLQSYESLGWMNGEQMFYVIPKGVKVLDLKFRETGFDSEFSGYFKCDDDFYNRLWQKSLRTLYVTMRDTYMDCPDRERAQWWGDEVLESGEAFYALDPSSNLLVKKGIYELVNWQRQDSTIYSPIPAGNWHNELPTQMLSSIGTFGFWNYYWHTGDKETIAQVYDKVEKYLALWNLADNGLVVERKGGWTWGDWGENKDMPILFNTQYYMALDSFRLMSELLGKSEKANNLQSKMEDFKIAFNSEFWNGKSYRSPNYKGLTDDRSQGLAVVSGLANKDYYPAILTVLQNQMHASPYMEKYVLEAMFQMGYIEEALMRMKTRFSTMVNHPDFTTLWEGWGIGKEGFGGGTTNHAWSGGGLTLLSQYVSGVYPTSAGYKTFKIEPQLGFLKSVSAIVPSVKGLIDVQIKNIDGFEMNLIVPNNTKAELILPKVYSEISISSHSINSKTYSINDHIELEAGTYEIKAK